MSTEKSDFKPLPLIISLAITLGVGGISAFFTVRQINNWYVFLQKPSFNPPNWIFGPVWVILYIMIGISAYLVWLQRDKSLNYLNAKYIYILQLLFNFLWSVMFFGAQQIFLALLVIILLLIIIITNIKIFSLINKKAAWLLAPYLLWVCFAAVLNYCIFRLNKH
jgi:translocator protein